MSAEGRIQRAARFLFEERQAHRRFGPIPDTLAPRTVDEAYAVQDALNTLLAGMLGPVAGYKIALTTAVMQQMVGLHEPIAGAILAKTIHQAPSTIRSTDYVHLGIDSEIAFQLGANLPADMAPYSRASVADAVAAAMVAFEPFDDRLADVSKSSALALSLIADNIGNVGIVLGPPVSDWRKLDLAAAHGQLVMNGELMGEGRGSDVMGHPLEALVWLANLLAKRRTSLTRGMVVTTGTLVALKFLKPGDSASWSVDGLGEAKLRVSSLVDNGLCKSSAV
jgi:2-keto-4-pentenoate hydratase